MPPRKLPGLLQRTPHPSTTTTRSSQSIAIVTLEAFARNEDDEDFENWRGDPDPSALKSIPDELQPSMPKRRRATNPFVENPIAASFRKIEEQKRTLEISSDLAPEQRAVVEAVVSGKSIFFTGCAGTGKSYTLKALTASLCSIRGESSTGLFFTAMTGVAASLLPGASTLHSFAGIGKGDGTIDSIIRRVKSSQKAVKNWEAVKVLVIDEVSMLSRQLFETLEAVAKGMRARFDPLARNKPFGGVQLVLCGDFFQLPPVNRKIPSFQSTGMQSGQDDDKAGQMCFESPLWDQVIKEHIVLKKVFRQQDQKLVDLLNQVRFNSISRENVCVLRSLNRPLNCPPGISPTRLTPFNKSADVINEERLAALPPAETVLASLGVLPSPGLHISSSHVYTAKDTAMDPVILSQLSSCTTFPTSITLRVGAQVMLLRNNSAKGLVNGSTGVVIGFKESSKIDRAEEEVLEKSTGPKQMDQDGDVQMKDIGDSDTPPLLPLVRFTTGSGHLEIVVGVDAFELESPTGDGPPRGRRVQLPLRLAWAITIHKSQGMTLDYVQVDLKNVFEAGQAYVALSRAKSMEGLQVLSFDENKFWCEDKVVKFYQGFEGKQSTAHPTVSRPHDTSKETISIYPAPPFPPVHHTFNHGDLAAFLQPIPRFHQAAPATKKRGYDLAALRNHTTSR